MRKDLRPQSRPDIEYPHHASLGESQNAKDEGCILCNAIWDRIPKQMDEFRTTWFRTMTYDSPHSELLFNSTRTMVEPDVLLWVEAVEGMIIEPITGIEKY